MLRPVSRAGVKRADSQGALKGKRYLGRGMHPVVVLRVGIVFIILLAAVKKVVADLAHGFHQRHRIRFRIEGQGMKRATKRPSSSKIFCFMGLTSRWLRRRWRAQPGTSLAKASPSWRTRASTTRQAMSGVGFPSRSFRKKSPCRRSWNSSLLTHLRRS